VLAAISNRVVNAGQVVSFTNLASDLDVPAQALTFSLLSPPAGAVIDMTNGWFTWRPMVSQAGTTNDIQIRVVDDGIPTLSVTQAFTVVVSPLVPATVQRSSMAGGLFTLEVTGPAGPDYTILASPDLTSWSPVFVTNAPAIPFSCTLTNGPGLTNRFFRLQVGP
jgi:hypothetical protein